MHNKALPRVPLAFLNGLGLCPHSTGAPKGIEFNSVKEVLLSLKMVKSMHNLRLWALTAGQTLVSVHVAIGETQPPLV